MTEFLTLKSEAENFCDDSHGRLASKSDMIFLKNHLRSRGEKFSEIWIDDCTVYSEKTDSISLLNKSDCKNQTATPFCEFSDPMEMSPEEVLNFGSEIDQCNFTSDENEGKAF